MAKPKKSLTVESIEGFDIELAYTANIIDLYVYQPVRINSTNMTKITGRAKWMPDWQCAIIDGKHIVPAANIVMMTLSK